MCTTARGRSRRCLATIRFFRAVDRRQQHHFALSVRGQDVLDPWDGFPPRAASVSEPSWISLWWCVPEQTLNARDTLLKMCAGAETYAIDVLLPYCEEIIA